MLSDDFNFKIVNKNNIKNYYIKLSIPRYHNCTKLINYYTFYITCNILHISM